MGKISVLMVMMFNIVFMYMGFNLSGIATHAYNNYTNYYCTEQAQFIAESASNIALGSINKNLLWLSSDSTKVYTYTIKDPSDSARVIGTYSIQAATSWPKYIRTVTFRITTTCGLLTEKSIIVLQTPQFSQFALFSVNDNGLQWATGEVCDGPLHTEGNLVCSGSPDFKGYVTVGGSITKSSATFEQGYKTGISIPFVNDYSAVKAVAGYNQLDAPRITYTSSGKTKTWQADLFVQFNSDGSIEVDTGQYVGNGLGYYYSKQGTGSSPYKTYSSVSALTSSGVFGILDTNSVANIHIRGTLKGQMTVANLGTGNVYIDSSVVYKDTLTDILGIVARDSVYVTDDTANNKNKFVNVQATICAATFSAQNYDTRVSGTYTTSGGVKTATGRGTLNLRGGIQQNNRGAVFSGNNGFSKNYKYDTRFQGSATPPGYPQLSQFSLLSWYDNVQWQRSWWDVW
jgi:hypothetical protein